MILSGKLHFFYLFDVGDTIDLGALRRVSALGVTAAPLPIRSQTSPEYIQFPIPPVIGPLPETQLDDQRFTARAKFFDYGVVSIRLTATFTGDLQHFLDLSGRLRSNDRLMVIAERYLATIMSEIAHAVDDPHQPLNEDYIVAEINHVEEELTANAFLESHAAEIVQFLLNETQPLSKAETDEALRVRFSYHRDDLAIIQWDATLIYDDANSALAIEDILEFANSQLLELRTYDAQLDRELDTIYAVKPVFAMRSFFGRRAAERAGALRYLLVDVLELIDRSSNALKIIGDAYYARIYRAAASRFGLNEWQRQVDKKLASVADFYRYLNDQARGSRDEFLEIIIIVLVAIEVVIGFITLHR